MVDTERGNTMTRWPDQPVIYEVNTAVWLGGLSRTAGRRLTLADVGATNWDAVTPAGIDAVWLMGVWERSRRGLSWRTRIQSCGHPSVRRWLACGTKTSSGRRTVCGVTSRYGLRRPGSTGRGP